VTINNPNTISAAVARNVRSLRQQGGLTLQQLANRSGLSKGMVVQIEQERTNPSLATLVRLANAFHVSLTRLLEVGEVPPTRIIRADKTVELWRGKAGGVGCLLGGTDLPSRIELWDWRLLPNDAFLAEPQAAGTGEILYVLEGQLRLEVDREAHLLEKGDVALFRPDRAHVYRNEGPESVRFIVAYAEPEDHCDID
jgi:transcriptional regulator with XRE-family HTH domain